MNQTAKTYNTKLALFAFLMAALVLGKLLITAQETANWPGFFYSSLHVAIVALGTYLALRKSA